MNNEALELLNQLIEIPSYVDKKYGINETKLVNFIERWAQDNLTCLLEKQSLGYNRFNLIIKKGEPRTLFLAHTDTVAPSRDDQLTAIKMDGQIWGRGATDMKSGLAALLLAAKNNPLANNFWILLYADEEYNFMGMKNFLKAYPRLHPTRIISADGSDLETGFACRGLIELRVRVHGESGHAAKANGTNAISAAYTIVNELQTALESQSRPELGSTSINLAYILGGQSSQNLSASEPLRGVGQAGNVIPDICEFVIDIRPATTTVTAKSVQQAMQSIAIEVGVRCEVVEITHDFSAWITPQSELESLLGLNLPIRWAEPQNTGYLDLQIMWQKYGRPPSLMFGGGLGHTAHSGQERIPIDNYQKTVEFFSTLMEKLCK